MNMNESTAGIFRRQRQLVVAVLTATLLATPLFTACDTGGEPQESPQGGGLPLSFLTTVEELRTRAELNTANLTTIGVFAYLTDGDFDQSTATPGFMFNQKVERKPVDVLSRKILVEQYDGQAEFLCLCPLC